MSLRDKLYEEVLARYNKEDAVSAHIVAITEKLSEKAKLGKKVISLNIEIPISSLLAEKVIEHFKLNEIELKLSSALVSDYSNDFYDSITWKAEWE